MIEINEPFEKQVFKLTVSSLGIVIPKNIIKNHGIEPGDVIVGIFKAIKKEQKDKTQKDK